MFDSTVNPLATQITLSAIVVAAIQWLKNSSWFPWLQNTSAKANRVASALLAIVTAVGIHIIWTHGSIPGSYMIGVTGLTLTGIASGAFAVIKSFVFQELTYRVAVKSPPAPPAAPAPAVPAAKS